MGLGNSVVWFLSMDLLDDGVLFCEVVGGYKHYKHYLGRVLCHEKVLSRDVMGSSMRTTASDARMFSEVGSKESRGGKASQRAFRFNSLSMFLVGNSMMTLCLLSQNSLASLLLSLQRAGWATRDLAMASSAWRSRKSLSGVWTTKVAYSAVPCLVQGCAGKGLKMLSSRWQSLPQVRLPAPISQPPTGLPAHRQLSSGKSMLSSDGPSCQLRWVL